MAAAVENHQNVLSQQKRVFQSLDARKQNLTARRQENLRLHDTLNQTMPEDSLIVMTPQLTTMAQA
jgi:hypothetical protein